MEKQDAQMYRYLTNVKIHYESENGNRPASAQSSAHSILGLDAEGNVNQVCMAVSASPHPIHLRLAMLDFDDSVNNLVTCNENFEKNLDDFVPAE